MQMALRVLDYYLVLLRRTFRGTIFSAFLSPVLFLLALGHGLGSLVDSASGGVDGVPYVQFIAPGVMAATAMQIAIFDASYPVLGSIKWNRQYHAMLATPLGVRDIVSGVFVSIALRALLSGAVFLAVAVALGAVPSPTAPLALVPVVLVAVSYAGPMFALAASVERDLSFTLVFRLVMTPMFLFSATFFPISQLPDQLAPVAYVIPLYHGVELARDATLGTLAWAPDLLHLAYLSLWCIGGLALATRRLRIRMVL